MASETLDMRQVAALGSDLQRARRLVRPKAKAVVVKGLLNVKKQLQQEAQAVQGGRIAPTISYDVEDTLTGVAGEVGPIEGHAGSLAFFYYGNSKIGPQLPEPMGAMDKELPQIKAYLAKALGDLLT